MSVNISVNGRYEKVISKKPSLLDDSERVRKDLESERRILRLRQVRQESNNLARKIRKEVDEEKQRQLKKLEDIKQKELNCWRQHVMVEKHKDFRSAVFQVGAAHRAAIEENESKQTRKEQLSRQTKPNAKLNNKAKPIKETHQKENEFNRQSTEKSTAKSSLVGSSRHDCCTAAQKNNTNKRRKLNKCCRKKPKQSCKHSDDSTDDVSLLSSDSTSSFHLSSENEHSNSSDKKKNLKKTDAVVLEVDVDSDESVSVSTKGAIEINDKFIETNRRFCRVVQKDATQRGNKLDQKTQKPMKTSPNGDDFDVENRPKSTTIRFTQISDFVKQCSEMENIGSSEKDSRQQTVDGIKTDFTSPKDVRPQQPSTRGPPESDNPNFGNLLNAGVSNAAKSSVSTSTVVIRHSKNSAASSNSARVKFYDYNNKYHKDYEQSTKSVQANLTDTAQLNAMDHAQIENQLQQLRELEIDKLRNITEQRCQKALEKEQVRRDCAELTEKLEALSRQHPQLLQNDANFVPSHRFVDLTTSREKKMDEIMEKMLLRPAIITCPEVTSKQECCDAARPFKEQSAINLGDRWTSRKDSTSASSESCCSLLLECVDDQTKKLRGDLKQTGVNAEKAEKLRKLLERIEQIRESLMKELKSGNVSHDGENVQNIIELIRQERSAILSDKQKSLDARESSLLKKEALLDKKIRALYDAKKACGDGTKKNEQAVENDQVMKHFTEKPLEIIIKVKSDGQVKKCIAKPKGIKKIAPKLSIQPPTRQKDIEQTTVTGVQRENSYDSNSTAYRSLPPTVNQTIDTLVQQLTERSTQAEPEATAVYTSIDVPQSLNPIIVHYVQRLLGMTRKSIQELGVSSSDVTTPTSSIINTSRNMSLDASVDESLIDEKRMKHVQDFIEDNRSFVYELEDTLRSHGNQSLESSMRVFDKIWIKRFEGIKCNENSVRNQTTNSKIKAPVVQPPSQNGHQVLTAATKSVTRSFSNNQEHIRNEEKINKLKDNVYISPISGEFATKTCSDSEKHIERYAKLTENCTQRIAELTELIHKVREEKQRLLEVTLTSTSDAGRNSTEYFELPTGQEGQRARTNSERSKTSETRDNRTSSTSETIPLSDNEPLQKHKLIGESRDSGIYESRPVTSQDQDPDVEPTSITSSSKGVAKQRRDKQYSATFQSLSPNMIEERQVHELSTIVEVDTPAPSSANIKAAGNNTTLKEANAGVKIRKPVKFPPFTQYAQELNLDISQISNDQSLRLQHEYNELLLAINQRSDNGVSYQEFPSIRAYLHNVTSTKFQTVNEGSVDLNSPQTIRELIQTLRMANIKIRSFPTQKEYIQKLLANKPENERDLIDSTSLENTTDYANAKQQIDSDTTDSFNVEAELKKRKILKASFQRTVMSTGDCVASSTQRDSAAFFTGALPTESGIEKLSGSQYDAVSDEIDREMQRLGMQWPATMRKRQKQAEALSSGSSDDHKPNPRPRKRNNVSQLQKAPSSSTVSNESGDFGRTLNLREFLTKELLKHVNQEISSSSDDSLKSNFLQSVIDSLTPSGGTPPTNNGMATGTAMTLDRQKTSTPVLSPRSSRTQSRSSPTTTQLFSGESKLSSVHYHKKDPSSHPNSRTDK